MFDFTMMTHQSVILLSEVWYHPCPMTGCVWFWLVYLCGVKYGVAFTMTLFINTMTGHVLSLYYVCVEFCPLHNRLTFLSFVIFIYF